MANDIKRIVVYCGANVGFKPEYKEAAVAVGRILAEESYRPCLQQWRRGIDGAVADAALAAGGGDWRNSGR